MLQRSRIFFTIKEKAHLLMETKKCFAKIKINGGFSDVDYRQRTIEGICIGIPGMAGNSGD